MSEVSLLVDLCVGPHVFIRSGTRLEVVRSETSSLILRRPGVDERIPLPRNWVLEIDTSLDI